MLKIKRIEHSVDLVGPGFEIHVMNCWNNIIPVGSSFQRKIMENMFTA